MIASSALLLLPNEVARGLAALLEIEDLNELACVCRATAESDVFNPPSRKSLLLPPTDRDGAGRLLASIIGRDAERLAQFAWIQIANAWHVDMLLESGAGPFVRSIRVCTEIDRSSDAVDAICESLSELPSLTKLDLSDTSIANLSLVAEMKQLRFLYLNRTDTSDVAPLASLANLEELELVSTRVVDMGCVENWTALRRLKVTHRRGDQVVFPSCSKLNSLESLYVETISIASAADIAPSLSNLKELAFRSICARSADGFENPNGATNILAETLADYLPQLEVLDEQYVATSASGLSRISSLRAIRHKLASAPGVEALTALVNLEELGFWLMSTTQPPDYRFLLELRSLKRMSIRFLSFGDSAAATKQMTQILEVLVLMPQFENLKLEARVKSDNTDALSRLKQLNQLSVSICPEIGSLRWIEPLSGSLRCLSIQVDTSHTDISALGSLKRLEELKLVNVSAGRSQQEDFPILHQLTKLSSLSIDGNIRNLVSLRGLTTLRVLMIRSKSVYPMMNADVLGGLTALRSLDISQTRITELNHLMRLTKLRRLAISSNANCQVLSGGKHPSLLQVLHPLGNCMWSCTFGTIREEEEIP